MKKRKKMPLPKNAAAEPPMSNEPVIEEQRFIDGFRELGITTFPAYSTADNFARQFTRCSLLKVENIELSGSSDSSTRRFQK